MLKLMPKILLIGLTTLGLGFIAPIVAQAQAGLPAGYTRTQTVIPGQHCYRSGGQVYFYCYPRAIGTYSPSGSMMQSSPRPSDTMMAPGGSMMQPSPRPSSSPGGSMMQPSPSPSR